MASNNQRLLIATAVVCGGTLATAFVYKQVREGETARRAALSAPLPLADSPFRNTRPGAGFAGMERCQSCHAEAHASYLQTAHSQALGDVKLDTEPPDGAFEDPASFKSYRIYRHDGKLYHEESIRSSAGETLVLASLPVRHVIGSGRFSRSYLIERDGFLFESPATWYSARPGWGLSPGYADFNQGFQRPAELRCLSCHVGRVEPVNHSPQRVILHARAIDCERCHGPGLEHAERRAAADAPTLASTDDDTIVNPSRLDRQRREDICAQCHLHSAAAVELRGRTLGDFRPGLALSDFVAHYGMESPKRQMDVVGHAEQMRLSRCYQASTTLTCTTCHDPHGGSAAAEPAQYRVKCLECHTEQSCREPRARRIEREPQDNCVACHMPRGPTEIPHFAFTHHRIGIHAATPESTETSGETPEPSELVSLADHETLPAIDRARNRGLAYLQVSDAPGHSRHGEIYRSRALEILEQVHAQGLVDVEVDAALARLHLGRNPEKALEHARAVVAAPHASPDALATASFVLGTTLYGTNRMNEAFPWLEKTTELRQNADVYVMLSDCLVESGKVGSALAAARRAAELAPDRPRYVQRYAALSAQTGDAVQARSLEKRIPILMEYRATMDRR